MKSFKRCLSLVMSMVLITPMLVMLLSIMPAINVSAAGWSTVADKFNKNGLNVEACEKLCLLSDDIGADLRWGDQGATGGHDWDSESMMRFIDYNGTSAFDTYLNNMVGLAQESGGSGRGLPLNVAATFKLGDASTPSATALSDTFFDWAGCSHSDLVKVFSDESSNGDNGAVYLGCDYSKKDKMFYYYMLAISRQADVGAHYDNFHTLVFRSETLVTMTANTEHVKLSIQNESMDNIDVIIQDLLIGSDGLPIHGKIMESGAGVNDNGQLRRLNNIVLWDSPSKNLYKMVFQNEGNIMMIFSDNDNTLSDVNVGLRDSRLSGDTYHYKISEIDVNLANAEFIDFGDSNGLVTKNTTNPFPLVGDEQIAIDIVCSVINSLCKTGKSDVLSIVDERANTFKNSYGCDFIHDLIMDFKDELEESMKAQAIGDTYENGNPHFDEILSDSSSNFEKMDAIIRYNIESIANGGKFNGTYKIGTVSYEFNTNGSTSYIHDEAKGLSFIWDSLTDYEKAVLSTAYTAKYDIISSRYSGSSSKKLKFVYGSDPGSFQAATYDIDFDKSVEIIKDRDQNLITTSNVLNVARSCNVLTRYIMVTALYTNSKNVESIYNVYDDMLDSLASGIFNYPEISDNVYPMLPKKIGLFGVSSSNYTSMLETDDNWKRFLSVLYNTSYAFEVAAWSDRGYEEGYTPEDIKRWFSNSEGADQMFSWLQTTQNMHAYDASLEGFSLDPNDTVSVNMLRSISELGKMCDFLGIGEGDWSPTIRCYLEIYHEYKSFFNLLDESGLIYQRAGTGSITVKEPLGAFFSIEGESMSDQWIKGFALSSLYVPMETNVYDASTVTFDSDSEWISGFFYKYAFFRKALYINTDNSAIVNKFTSGQESGTRVATLRDLLNYDRDIVLTVDDNFYNANKIDTVISRLDYTAIRNTDNADTEDTGSKKVENYISGMMDLDAGKVLKTGADMYYSDTLATGVTPLGSADEVGSKRYDSYVLSPDEILGNSSSNPKVDSVLDSYEYSVKMSYGVVSAIYRSQALYNECLRAIVSDNAIFKSSKAICSTPGTSSSDWRSVYNYYMLANLQSQMKNDSASTLDLDAPIFCDVFGNIVTESGLVIIPAAANATLCGTNWTPYTVGWSEYYNNGEHIVMEDFNEDVYEWLTGLEFGSIVNMGVPQDATTVKDPVKENAGGYFWLADNELILKTTDLTSNNLTGTVQFDNLNKNSTVVKQLFFNDAYFNKGRKIYSHRMTNLVIEVLRGAPIEHIDYEYEGLSGNLNISKYGVYMAYKLEELVNTLVSGINGNSVGGNSVITMPNLAFVNGVEYIMLYVFKIVFAAMVVGLGVSLYLDAVRNSLGIKSILKFLGTCIMCLVAFTLVPNIISWTYYDANKSLLSDEAGRIMMLNYVKEYDGSEIGITSVTTPETNTELYLKVNDVSVNWWEIIPEVLFGDTFSTVTELYEDQLSDDPMALNQTVQMKGDGLYVDIQEIFDSTALQFTPATNMLSHFQRLNSSAKKAIQVKETTIDDDGNITENVVTKMVDIGRDSTSVVSYVSPYYAILQQLVNNVNEYNVSRDITAYSWSVGSNGNILTYDVLTPYLTSAEFLEEGFDVLGLETLLGIQGSKLNYNYAFSSEQAERMYKSLWWPSDLMSQSIMQSKIDEVYEYSRNFVINNQDVLGKVPDEVFLKVMAMQIAVKYNKVFNVPMGNGVEIINVDTRDLMRFMVAPSDDIYRYYSYSFSRYVYEEAGTIGVILSGILLVVCWLTSFVKPLVMIVILALLIINVVLRKVLFRKESKCVEGYLIGCACLCLCNYAYSLMLKVSMSIANWGMGSATALLCAVVVQIIYVAALVGIVVIEMKDWRNSGYGEFQNIGQLLSSKLMQAKTIVVERLVSRTNTAYKDSSDSRRYAGDNYDPESVDSMLERDREREERGSYNPN